MRVLSSDISVSSEQQSAGISEIASAVATMQINAQQTAAVAEENAASALELQSQSESMQAVVTDLSRIVNGRQRPEHTEAVWPSNPLLNNSA